ncbi:MAG: preprotein translocase subunit SecG [Planctomycetes bacterium]|nr:preprotein translocase subunit SecG [Planctomycetota bacterium]
MSILLFILTGLFALSSLLLIGIILIQESKGGGLSEAFGGMGGETFGHKASGANKVTWALAAVWILTAVGHHLVAGQGSAGFGSLKEKPAVTAPEIPGGAQAPNVPSPGK